MSKIDAGQKRICAQCASKFFDLNRTPIICPTCSAEFFVPPPVPVKPPRSPRRFQMNVAAREELATEIPAFDTSREKNEEEAADVLILDEEDEGDDIAIAKPENPDAERRDRET
jgi:uncharacterized protein (TIGR02300 family)